MQKIVLITSGQPALNPRLVKEADSLVQAGYEVTVLYAYWNDWGTQIDTLILPEKKWKAVRIGGDPVHKPAIYLLSRVVFKIVLLLYQTFKLTSFKDLAIARSSFFLRRAGKKYKADLYIGHNLGALPAVVKAAKINHTLCGFDAEDFHRYETSDDDFLANVILKKYIEDKYFPQLNYLSVSSPGINNAYRQLYKNMSPTTILNVFPVDSLVAAPKPDHSGIIKLFWFSQTISASRGVSDCISALQLLDTNRFELHLLGYISNADKRNLTEQTDNKLIIFHKPIPPDEIAVFAAKFDVGLALEDSIPYNRDICLTNKIFTYMQAGLAIIASDTSAQKELLTQYPETGICYEQGNVRLLANAIRFYADNTAELLKTRQASYNAARKKLNWGTESEKFLSLVKNVLAS